MRKFVRWFPARAVVAAVVLGAYLVGLTQEPPTVHFHRPPTVHATP